MPTVLTGHVRLAGLPSLVTVQVLYGLQQRSRSGAQTRVQVLRAVVPDLRRAQATSVHGAVDPSLGMRRESGVRAARAAELRRDLPALAAGDGRITKPRRHIGDWHSRASEHRAEVVEQIATLFAFAYPCFDLCARGMRIEISHCSFDDLGGRVVAGVVVGFDELKRKIRSIAMESFFDADSSKFGREALFKVFGFEDLAAGITDSTLDPIRAAQFPIPIIRVAVGTT